MMILLLLLLPFASAGKAHNDNVHLVISIKPGPTEGDTTINYRGADIKPLTEQEKETFKITKENLKKAVEALSHQKPTDVFLNNAPNVYKTHNWREVKREFKINGIKIANVTAKVEKQSEKKYTSNETKTATIKAHIYEAHFSFHSTHSWEGNVEVSAAVRYELVRPAKVPLHYSYGSEVGGDEFSSGLNIFSYGDTAAKFNLSPGQSAKFILNARTIENVVEVEYETTLTGDVVARYADRDGYKGKEFWSYDVNELLSALNVSKVVATREFVKIVYIKDYLVEVVDVMTEKDIPYTDLDIPDY